MSKISKSQFLSSIFGQREYVTGSGRETEALGQKFGQAIIKNRAKTPVVLGLIGDLGSGKTTFLKGLAKGLKIKNRITSPTFVIIKQFDVPPKTSFFKYFYHIDCYRIEKPEEILGLNFFEIISSPFNIVAIEWADRIKKLLPPRSILLEFKFVDKTKRKIRLKNI